MIHNRKKVKRIIIWTVMIVTFIVAVGSYIFNNKDIFEEITYQKEKTISDISEIEKNLPKTLPEKIKVLKDRVRNKIMNGESAGIVVKEGDLFPTFDPHEEIIEKCRRIGGKMNLDCLSFGSLQFKISTIVRFEKELNGIDVTEIEALIIAHDIERAAKLFDDIVYGIEGGIWMWAVANRDKSYYSTVIPIIRELME